MTYKRMSEYGQEAAQTQALEPASPSPAELERVEAQLLREVERRAVKAAKITAAEAAEEISELVTLTRALRETGQIRDPAKTARYLATVFNVLTQGGLILEGKPTQIHAHIDAEASWATVARRFGIVDASYEEIPEATETPREALEPASQ